jgi:BirA family biotin operon repressor/biotin-[acetyl-CoA-carboxylase] ligase
LLADGRVHSGPELAAVLGVSRAAVWKQVRQLGSLGIEVRALPGKGYQLSVPVELLSVAAVEAALSAEARARVARLDVHWLLDSTSDELLRQPRAAPDRAHVCLAEYQSGGRGRRGRRWFAAAGEGLCLSVAWCFPQPPASLSCLGLAVGIGALRALRRVGAGDAQLKWPNDIVLGGRKLAGILVDVQGEAGGPLQIVAGVGVNYALSASTLSAVEAAGGLRPASLAEARSGAGGSLPGRARVAAALIDGILEVLREFAAQGFERLAGEWRAADSLQGSPITVMVDTGSCSGIASGISADGQLRVLVDGRIREFMTGDVSVRASA